jgi:hypothetical protein
MIAPLRHLLGWIVSAFSSRESLILENLALRQQLLALHAKRPRRRLTAVHKLFWVMLRRVWSGWNKPLILVTPRTVYTCIQIASKGRETTNRLGITISADCNKHLACAYIDAGCIRVQDGQFLTPFL